MTDEAVEAVMLTGGLAQRLGGVRKGEIDVGCGPLLVGELDAVVRAGIDRAVVVGPGPLRSPTGLELSVTREDPPFGGPGAAVAAALPLLRAPWVLLLACDLPGSARLVPVLLRSWRQAVDDDDQWQGVVLEAGGRPQWLAGIYRTEPLRQALAETPPAAAGDPDVPPRGPAIGRVLDRLRLHRVPDADGVTRDVDTPEDLAWWTDQVTGGFLRAPRSPAPTPEETIPMERSDDGTPSGLDEWLAELEPVLGLDAQVDVGAVLDVAREAAHGVARPAGPLTTFAVGLAIGRRTTAGEPIDDVMEDLAAEVRRLVARRPGAGPA